MHSKECFRMVKYLVHPACLLPATDFSFGYSEQLSSCQGKICHIWTYFLCATNKVRSIEKEYPVTYWIYSKLLFDEQMDFKWFKFIKFNHEEQWFGICQPTSEECFLNTSHQILSCSLQSCPPSCEVYLCATKIMWIVMQACDSFLKYLSYVNLNSIFQ